MHAILASSPYFDTYYNFVSKDVGTYRGVPVSYMRPDDDILILGEQPFQFGAVTVCRHAGYAAYGELTVEICPNQMYRLKYEE